MLLLVCLLVTVIGLNAQNVTITPNGITPVGTHPRLSYDDILALPNPQEGDIAYDLTFKCLRVYNGNKWICSNQNLNNFTPDIAAIIRAGEAGDEYASGIAVDGNGNIYIAGTFQGSTTIGTSTITSAGGFDIFIAKYNSSGVFQWVQRAGSTNQDYAASIAVDGSGNAYITGNFRDAATFGESIVFSAGGADVFIAKYSSAGGLQWVQRAGGANDEFTNSIAVDGSGNAYITGSFRDTATFGTATITSAGFEDIFIAKYSSSLNSWAFAVRAGGISFADNGQSIAVDGSGNVYITGAFYGTVTFGAFSFTSAGSSDIFIAKYDPTASAWVFANRAGSGNSDQGRSIAVDGSGNAYITGNFREAATFSGATVYSAGDTDMFIAKYNTVGVLQWVQRAGGSSAELPESVAVDGNGNTYVTGRFLGTATFGTTTVTSANSYDIFVAKYNNAGVYQWVQKGGGTNNDGSTSIAIAGGNNVYVLGYFRDTATFGNTTIISAGDTDIFVCRLKD